MQFLHDWMVRERTNLPAIRPCKVMAIAACTGREFEPMPIEPAHRSTSRCSQRDRLLVRADKSRSRDSSLLRVHESRSRKTAIHRQTTPPNIPIKGVSEDSRRPESDERGPHPLHALEISAFHSFCPLHSFRRPLSARLPSSCRMKKEISCPWPR